ncbi:MAG: ROK family protein [Burkholderiaceae bacterium]|nr:ROK family protein [Burkholderiaceae bacterium]
MKGTPGSLRRVHRSLVLRGVFDSPGISRGELADRLGLSQMAIGRIVRELEVAGLVVESVQAPASGRGRPASALGLRADGAYAVGAVLSAYSQEVTVVDLCGNPIGTRPIAIEDISDGEAVLGQACDAIASLLDSAGIDASRVAGASFSVAVNVDPSRGVVLGGGYLGWKPFDLGVRAEAALGAPVSVERVADTLVRAETFHGCAPDARAVVLIHAATTLGMSVWFDGALMRGAGFHAGRIGHFPTRPTRMICSCGRSDCLNCVASGWSVLVRLGEGGGPAYAPARVRDYARQIHDLIEPTVPTASRAARVRRLLGDAGVALARALAYVDLSFDPDVVIVAGSLARNDSYFRGLLRGLQQGGAVGADLVRKTTRSTMAPVHAAALVALLDHVYSPGLELDSFGAGAGVAGGFADG